MAGHDTSADGPQAGDRPPADAPATGAPTPGEAIETVVPPGETPAAECPYCGRPFRDETLCPLLVGGRHGDRCTPAEHAAYEAARDDEGDELFMYHMRVIGALGVGYALLVLVYMVVLAS
jgi:hypothetical protein